MARIARIATTVFGGYRPPDSLDWRRRKGVEFAHAAGRSHCDLLLLPEMFMVESDADLAPERVAHDCATLQGLAGQYGMYILAGMPYWEGDICANAAVLFDRSGKIAGVHRKIHLTDGDLKHFVAGDTPPRLRPGFWPPGGAHLLRHRLARRVAGAQEAGRRIGRVAVGL